MARLGRSIPVGARISRGSVAPGLLIDALTDDFTAGSVDTTKWPGNFGTTSQSGGLAHVACDTGFNAFQSAKIYGLYGAATGALVQIYSPAASTATTAFGELIIGSDQQPTGTQLSFKADAAAGGGQLIASVQVGFADGGAVTTAYNPLLPIWVWIQPSGANLLYRYSQTGFSFDWTTLRTVAMPDWVTTSAVGAYLQAHRDAGVNDEALFDNFGLAPADPIAAPAPIVIKAQRYRPRPPGALLSHGYIPPDPDYVPPPIVVRGQRYRALPPGATLLRGPDLRPAPSNRVGVGLDGSLPIPLAVRLTSSTTDVMLVAEIRDLSFRSVIPGGYASATVTLDRPLSVAAPEISIYARMFVYDTRSGETVWEGRLEDPGRNSSDDGQTWQVTAVGPSAHARDQTFAYIPILSNVQSFEKFGGSLSSATVSTSNDASDNDGVRVQFAGGISVPTNGYVSGRDLSILNAGLSLASVAATAAGGGVGQWTENLYAYGPSGAQLIDSVALDPAQNSMRGVVGSDFSAGQTTVHLRMDRTGGAATPDDNAWTMWTDVVIRTTLVDEEGSAVTNYADDFVTSSQIVADLIGGYLPLYDGFYAFIATTTLQHTQIAYPDGTTAYDIFADLMALEGNVFWAAWETVPTTGLWRVEFSQWSDEVQFEAGIEDGFDSPGSAADLYNTVLVRWTDSVGRKRTTVRTSTVDVLTAAGLTRTAEISLGTEVGTSASANAAGDAFLAAHKLPSQNGRLTIARPILDVKRGMMVHPWEIRPGGGLIRVRGIDPAPNAVAATGRDGSTLFRIIATSFRASDGSVELELDSDALSTSQAIAQLQTSRTRR